jgi:hypothetical protein
MNQNIQNLKKILKNDNWLTLRRYLTDKLLELRNIDNINEKDTPTNQAIEMKAQKRAYEKLKEILTELSAIELSNDLAKPDKRDQYYS